MIENDSTVYNLFITHSKTDNEEYDRFIGKLNLSHDFEWKDRARMDRTRIDEITEQMKSVDVAIILSGLYSKDKDLVLKVVDIAVKLDKPIVVIRPYGMENVPGNIEDLASEVVGWNTPCIVEAIRESSQYEYDD